MCAISHSIQIIKYQFWFTFSPTSLPHLSLRQLQTCTCTELLLQKEAKEMSTHSPSPQSAEQRGNDSSTEIHVCPSEEYGLFRTRDAVLLQVGKWLMPPENHSLQ